MAAENRREGRTYSPPPVGSRCGGAVAAEAVPDASWVGGWREGGIALARGPANWYTDNRSGQNLLRSVGCRFKSGNCTWIRCPASFLASVVVQLLANLKDVMPMRTTAARLRSRSAWLARRVFGWGLAYLVQVLLQEGPTGCARYASPAGTPSSPHHRSRRSVSPECSSFRALAAPLPYQAIGLDGWLVGVGGWGATGKGDHREGHSNTGRCDAGPSVPQYVRPS